jgi:hypothetical protein
MKLVIYTLNSDGTIPDYIIDGGYFDVPNNGSFPQNVDLVGVATDVAPQTGFFDMNSLLTYVQEKNLTFKNSITKETIPLSDIVNTVWSKLSGDMIG